MLHRWKGLNNTSFQAILSLLDGVKY